MIDRYVMLRDLVGFAKPISELRGLLGTFKWDFDGIPLTMTRRHLRDVIERYMKGEISAQDIEDWANLIEGREDMTFESRDDNLLSEIVYELANPELTEELSYQRAKEIVDLLNKS